MPDLDLFCGAGGASTGLAILGREVVGVDHDRDACCTHAAVGHPTVRSDLTSVLPLRMRAPLVWASPPCTAFSLAGKGAGREVSDQLIGAVLAERWEPLEGHDAPVWLVLPTMAALLDLEPDAICMENVPPTLPVMHACAQVLERHGWHTAVGVLSAEAFGVAQTRKRAFLLANRSRRVALPEPTHQTYGDEPDEAQGSLFGTPLQPWISMATALGWSGEPDQPTHYDPRFTYKNGETVPVSIHEPNPGLTSSGLAKGVPVWRLRTNGMDRDTVREVVEPAPTVVFGHNSAAWGWERPSTTLVSSFRPDVVAGPGYRLAGDGPRQDAPGSIQITHAEAARLQAFPNDHAWRGSRTSVFRQIGNAVPPPVAAAVAGAALGISWQGPVGAYLSDLYSVALESEERAAG